MILLYDPKKIYNPNDLTHKMRRGIKQQVERRYIRGRLNNRVLKMLLNLPIIRQAITYMNKILLEGTNVPRIEEQLNGKEGKKCL